MLVEELFQMTSNWKESTYVGPARRAYIKTLEDGKLIKTHEIIGCGLDEEWNPFLMVEKTSD